MAMLRICRSAAAILLILATISSSCNTNKKYVKGELIWGSNRCNLGSLVSDGEQQTVAFEDLERMLSPEAFAGNVEKEVEKPRAVVQTLERSLLGSGAHREVHSAISLELELGGVDETEMSGDDCELVVLEHLSSGVFADPFQLHRLQQLDAVTFAKIYGDVDLERPAKNSFQSIVELHQRLVPDKQDTLEVLYRSEVTLPLHARYPPTSSESHFVVNITMPLVLIYCKGGDPVTGRSAKLKQELCIYAQLGDRVSKIPSQLLQWSIPSGYPDHSAWVGRLTTSAGLAGLAAIYVASKFSNKIVECNRDKKG